MPPRKSNPDPCDDWENEDYDIPATVSHPSTDATSDNWFPNDSASSINPHRSAPSESQHSEIPPDPLESENSLLWKNANRNPQYVILPANAAHSAVTANRPLVQDTMFGKTKVTILKRPKVESAERSLTNSTSSSTSSGDLSSREKAYLKARERIFGPSRLEDQPSAPSFKLNQESSMSNVSIQRQPNGPISADHKGFNSRQKSVATGNH